jgi:hypothetical protein
VGVVPESRNLQGRGTPVSLCAARMLLSLRSVQTHGSDLDFCRRGLWHIPKCPALTLSDEPKSLNISRGHPLDLLWHKAVYVSMVKLG